MNYEKIGAFIQKKRKEKCLTQKELAKKIGVTDKAVSKWERGLGCPDVSILEILSKELGVSILEILKGRIIENEIIKLTEANDYIKETINYSKENNKRIINKIIIFLVCFIVFLLVLLNISNMILINKKYDFNFDGDITTNIKNDIKEYEKNITIIKSNQGKYNDDDYKKIIDNLEDCLKVIDTIQILKYSGMQEFSLKDLYLLDLSYQNMVMPSLDTLNILKEYDSDIENYYKIYQDNYFINGVQGIAFYEKRHSIYKYQLSMFKNSINNYANDDDYYVLARLMNAKYNVSSFLYLTQLVMEVGEIYE